MSEALAALRSVDADSNRHYTYPPTGEQFVSVTSVLGATEGKPWLTGWSSRVAARYAVTNLDLIAEKIRTEGEEAAFGLIAEQSEQIRSLKADAGTYVHDVVEALVLWSASPAGAGSDIALPLLPEHLQGALYDDEPVEDVTAWMVEGFLNFMADFGPQILAAEMAVFSPELRTAGTLDLIAALRRYGVGTSGRLTAAPGTVLPLCVDIKTGKHLSVTWREQIAAYRRMPECLLPLGDMAPMPATEAAAVLHLRPEHDRCYRLMLISGADDAKAWATFRSALSLYHDRAAAKPKPGKVCRPMRADGTIPQPHLADLDGEGWGRALGPLMRAGIPDLEALAAMTAGQCVAIHRVGPKTVNSIRALLAAHGLCLAGEQVTSGGKVA